MASLLSVIDRMKNHVLAKHLERPYVSNALSIDFYAGESRGGDGTLYLAQAAALGEIIHKNEAITVFVYDGDEAAADMLSRAAEAQTNIIITSLVLSRLYTRLNAVVEAYRRQTGGIVELALRQRSIMKVFETCASATGAELYLEDENGRRISPRCVPRRPDDSAESVFRVKADAAEIKADLPTGRENAPRVRLAVKYPADNTELDYHALLLDVSLAVSRIIDESEYGYWLSSELEKLLFDLIEKRLQSDAEISERLVRIFGKSSRFYIFVIVEFKAPGGIDFPAAIKQLEALIPGARGAEYDRRAVLMVPTESASCDVQHDGDGLLDFLKKHDACAAFGNGTSFRCKLRTMFLLCREIMEIGKLLRISQKCRVFHFSEYSTYLSMRFCIEGLRQLTGDDDVLVLGNPDCVRVFDYDKKNKDNLLDVLYYYLTNSCNYQKTAAVSFMHRNTIVYKVKKLNQLLGYDISLCPDTYRLLFSAELYRFYFRMQASKYRKSELSIDFPTCMQSEESMYADEEAE